jgi:hypothetical protein
MRMKRTLRPRAARFFLVAATLLALAGCKGATDIKKLLDNPAAYEGKTVRIAGTVKDTAGILNYGVFTVDDGTGTIAVITKVGGAPREGAKVGVEGTFRSAFTLGTKTVAAIEETKRQTE